MEKDSPTILVNGKWKYLSVCAHYYKNPGMLYTYVNSSVPCEIKDCYGVHSRGFFVSTFYSYYLYVIETLKVPLKYGDIFMICSICGLMSRWTYLIQSKARVCTTEIPMYTIALEGEAVFILFQMFSQWLSRHNVYSNQFFYVK